jgi:hypothetical protein
MTTVERNIELAGLFVVCLNYKIPLYTSVGRVAQSV